MSDDREKLGLSLCPFCGGAARFGKCAPGEQEAENDGAEYIECCDCGASTCLVFPLMDSAKQVLRDMWNRRTDAHHEPANFVLGRQFCRITSERRITCLASYCFGEKTTH